MSAAPAACPAPSGRVATSFCSAAFRVAACRVAKLADQRVDLGFQRVFAVGVDLSGQQRADQQQ